MTKNFYLNGEFVPATEALIGITDIGLLRGFGIFDYFLVHGGRPLFMDYHLRRFQQSALKMGVKVPLTVEEMQQKLYALFALNQTFDAGIRLVLTGGYSEDSYTPTDPNFFILEQKYNYVDVELKSKGVRLLLHRFTRNLPEIKTTNYTVPILQIPRLREAGAFDVLYHDGEVVSESSRSNFFAVLPGNRIITPNRNILFGITRQHVLEVARFTNYQIEEGRLSLADLAQAKEAFLTSTTKGILPVVSIDGQTVGDGEPGPVTIELMAYWDDYVEQFLEKVNPVNH